MSHEARTTYGKLLTLLERPLARRFELILHVFMPALFLLIAACTSQLGPRRMTDFKVDLPQD